MSTTQESPPKVPSAADIIDDDFVDIDLAESIDSSSSKEKQISVDPISVRPRPRESRAPRALDSLVRQHSASLSHASRAHQLHLHRSKSCGDGRSSTPSNDLDMLSRKPSIHVTAAEETDIDERFKCGALCLFLPGLSSKAKQVQPKVDDDDLSRAMSLKKFECVSWASSAMVDEGESEGEGGGGAHSYFDLPLELIQDGGDDAHSPVKAAFVFDGDRKGVLKKSGSARRSLVESGSRRQVRFSTATTTSYPSSPKEFCISPRLRRAREEFNAFLEAQNV